MHTHRIITAFIVLFFAMAGIPAPAQAQPQPLVYALAPDAPAATRTYPGAAPCDTTLQACITASADGDTVQIAVGTYVTASLSVTRAVSIIGLGAGPSGVKLRPTSGRMFTYDAPTISASQVISNLTIENAVTSGGSGGAIRVNSLSGAPLFHSLVISNNTVTFVGGGGGGIRVIPSIPVTMVNMTVFSNTSGGGGGGISVAGALTLLDSSVMSNTSPTSGGGVEVFGEALISNTQILTNVAGSSGGGIVAGSNITIVAGAINKNTAQTGNGGGIYASPNTTVTLAGIASLSDRLNVNGNTALSGNGGAVYVDGTVKVFRAAMYVGNTAPAGEGGAFYLRNLIDDNVPSATNIVWMNNTSSGNGGAVRALGNVNLCSSRPAFSANFVGNGVTANGDGGAIYADGSIFLCSGPFQSSANFARIGGAYYSKTSVTLNGHNLGQNKALQHGGCIFSEGSVLFNNADADGCRAVNGDGGAVNAITVTIQGNGSLLQNNIAAGAGGALRGVFVSISAATLFSNTASTGGGASATGQVHITGATFISNTARFDGGAAEAGARMVVTSSVFTTNRVTNTAATGGALFGPSLLITGSSFFSNTALNSNGMGGAAYGALVTATNSAFAFNRATFGGGISATTSVVAGGIFTGNSVFQDGGGVYVFTGTIASSRFISNTANICCNGEGGGLWMDKGRIENSYFEGNLGDDEGAGAYVSSTVVVSQSQFIRNKDAFYDGASALRAGNNSLVVGSLFDGNSDRDTSDGGGAIDFAAAANVWVYDSTFVNNKGNDGGAVHGVGSNTTISNSTFYNNVSTCCGSGGAAYLGSGTIASSSFISNYADCCNGGGALHLLGSFSVQDSQFLSNTVEERMDGGAILAEGNIYIQRSEFANNAVVKAGSNNTGQGGAIKMDFTTIGTIESSRFTNNRANHGGAVACDYRCEILASRFESNVADQPDTFTFTSIGKGGAIQSGGDLVVQRSKFLRNKAGAGGGGAVFQNRTNPLMAADAVYENNLFAENLAQNTVLGSIGNAVVISGTVNNGKFLFNTVVSDALTANSALVVMSGAVSVVDNIFTNHALAVQRGATANVFENFNLWSGNTANTGAGVISGGSSFTATPQFMSAAQDGYHLKPGSPGIDAGTDALVYVDYDGQTRPQGAGFDIGFDEGGLPWAVYMPNTLRSVSAGW